VKRFTLGVALSSLALSTVLIALPARAGAAAPAAATAASIPGLRTSGTLTFGTNFPYPPMEYFTGDNADVQTGADVDLGKAIATHLGLKASFSDVTDFGTIIIGLQSHHYDAIISSLNETPDRAKVMAFIPYANVGQSILVRKGNPLHTQKVADLSGQKVGVQSGTVELDTLNNANSDLSRLHKPLIQIFKFPQDATAVLGLQTGRFTAIMEDYPVAAYNATQRPQVFQIAGQQIAPSPYAMAFRKSDTTLRVKVSQALAAMRKDGTYIKILKKYGLQQAAL